MGFYASDVSELIASWQFIIPLFLDTLELVYQTVVLQYC